MSALNGTNAKVVVSGSVTVARLASWSVNDNRSPIEIEPFNSTKSEIVGTGIRKINGSVSGWLDVSDPGQVAMKSHYDAGTAISGVRLYINTNQYYDLGDEFYLTSFSSSAAQGQAITVAFNFSCSDFDLT
jgi:hypothetical protein